MRAQAVLRRDRRLETEREKKWQYQNATTNSLWVPFVYVINRNVLAVGKRIFWQRSVGHQATKEGFLSVQRVLMD